MHVSHTNTQRPAVTHPTRPASKTSDPQTRPPAGWLSLVCAARIPLNQLLARCDVAGKNSTQAVRGAALPLARDLPLAYGWRRRRAEEEGLIKKKQTQTQKCKCTTVSCPE